MSQDLRPLMLSEGMYEAPEALRTYLPALPEPVGDDYIMMLWALQDHNPKACPDP
jgi:hypothetical protein